MEDATNDVRNAVARSQAQLPADIDDPVVAKSESDAQPIMWLALRAEGMSLVDLSDYADRYVVDRLSVLDGVSNVVIGGQLRRSLKIWIDSNALAARGLERRIAVQVPHFMSMPALVQGSDMICTLPRRMARHYADHFALRAHALPFSVPQSCSSMTTSCATSTRRRVR